MNNESKIMSESKYAVPNENITQWIQILKAREEKGILLTRCEVLYLKLSETSFFTDPASAVWHCNYPGGLLEHSDNVRICLKKLTRDLKLKWKNYESPEIIGMAHDVCKIGQYLPDGNGGYTKNPDHPKGHGDRSVEIVKQWIELTDEEEYCIRWHMGAYDVKENWQLYNDAIHRFPNVLWTHTADMMATHIYEIPGGKSS